MRLKSLRSKLLAAVSALVICSGLLIALLVTQQYSSNLYEAMTLQAKHLAHSLALESVDKILINDLVALQKSFDNQLRSNPTIAYLFIQKDGRVLAHTFPKGVPVELVNANKPGLGNQEHSQKIATTGGEDFMDIAWPILEGNAGILRLGLSQKPYHQKLFNLWLQMSLLTLVILLLALNITRLFVKKITRPLAALTQATKKIDKGELGVRVQVQGEDEVGSLASSFNHMVARLEEYTCRLEEQTNELERAHHQTRTFCGIAQEIGALRTLNEVGSYLIRTFKEILKCDHMVLLFLSENSDFLCVSSTRDFKILKNPEVVRSAAAVLEDLPEITFSKKPAFRPPIVAKNFETAVHQAIIPFHHEKQPFGALVIPCPGKCHCSVKELDGVGLILSQAAGVIKRALSQEEEVIALQSRLGTSAEFSGIVGKDPKMQVIYRLIEEVAPTDASVLIQGESGTGKELVARAIHQLSLRKGKPFVVINCSAYPATLLESELFGHEKGAFTGAIRQKSGRFEQAHGGTVFLDEIGEVPPSAQIKLLRVLQTRRFERLGGENTITVDVRILAATNKDLLQEVKAGNFREDLYYRLNVIPIHLPPLRERPNDIPLLGRHFLRRFALSQDKKIEDFSPEAMRLLLNCSWPGNVRELENSIEHAVVLAKGRRCQASDLPAVLLTDASSVEAGKPLTLVEHERKLLQEVLEECGWNKKQAAKRLGISRSSLYDKLKKYQVARPTTH